MSGAGSGVPITPSRGSGRGSVRRGGVTTMKGGGGAGGTTVSLQRTCIVEGGVGDVGGVHLWLDGGMERGDAQTLLPPGAGKVPGEGEKGMVRCCPCSKIL